MKKLALGNPTSQQDIGWAIRALKRIEQASREDIEALVDDYEITGDYVPTRTLDAGATLTDLVAFVATLISDLQQRGQNRST